MEKKDIFKRIFLMIIIMYIFLISINLLSGSFKLFGSGFAEQLVTLTSNPFVALFIGILATVVVQSSSVTTSLAVGMAASGVLSLQLAIPLIIGANIGTTVTNTLVSLVHIKNKEEFKAAFAAATVHDFFNILAVIVILPLELIFHVLENSAVFITSLVFGTNVGTFNSPLYFMLKPVTKSIMAFLGNNPYFILPLSMFLIYASLTLFVKIVKPLAETEFKAIVNKHLFKNTILSFIMGILVTVMVQSSSLATSMMVPLAATGILSLKRIFPYTLGSNIGTTITAFLAALATTSQVALTVALCHLLFNIYGIILILPFREIPIKLANYLAHLSLRSKFYPLAYISLVYFMLPISIIGFF